MDVSKEYIEMCEKAVELREQSPLREDIHSCCYLGDYNYMQKENYFHQGSTPTKIVDGVGYSEIIKIWLPRQDQLQEMVLSKEEPDFNFVYWLEIFYEWYENEKGYYFDKEDNEVDFKSMEQLWLAFVMAEKYNKRWDGKEWITI